MIYSLIPAKTHSSRLPGKNTFSFMLGGKPVISYTIEAVKNAGIQPVVFTDEDGITATYGAEIVRRGPETTTPAATMKETVGAFIKQRGIKGDDVILLTYATCPFRTERDIDGALNLFHNTGSHSLQTLTPVDYRPYGLMERHPDESYCFRCLRSQDGIYQKQNTPALFKANGAIYIFRVSELKDLNNQMFESFTVGYELDDVHGLDIDTPLDFMLAEKIVERLANERIAHQLSGQRIREAEPYTSWSRLHFERSETSRT